MWLVARKILGANIVWVLFRHQALCQLSVSDDVTGPGGSRLGLNRRALTGDNRAFKNFTQKFFIPRLYLRHRKQLKSFQYYYYPVYLVVNVGNRVYLFRRSCHEDKTFVHHQKRRYRTLPPRYTLRSNTLNAHGSMLIVDQWSTYWLNG